MPCHALACHGIPWHAMACHGMPWHAMACSDWASKVFGPVAPSWLHISPCFWSLARVTTPVSLSPECHTPPPWEGLWFHTDPHGCIWDPFGTHLAPYGQIVGSCWTIWTIWDHMDPYGAIWDYIFPHVWGYIPYIFLYIPSLLSPIWGLLGIYKPIWAHMDPYGIQKE